jgi:hypothetical protein
MKIKQVPILLLLITLSIPTFSSANDTPNILIPPRLTIAMWDYSWLTGHYPGGWAEDYNKVTDELIERKFNTVRIDAFPMVIHDLISKSQTKYLIPAQPYINWA